MNSHGSPVIRFPRTHSAPTQTIGTPMTEVTAAIAGVCGRQKQKRELTPAPEPPGARWVGHAVNVDVIKVRLTHLHSPRIVGGGRESVKRLGEPSKARSTWPSGT